MAPQPLHKADVNVPWLNSYEWRNVYDQLFGIDSTRETMINALNTLTIWKTRMPRLYSGIEGTLILLKGLLEVNNELPEDIKRQVLAAAIMRFLNVCLAGTSKNQETFFHIARTRNLPEWIVNIRHDFTHSQKLPSIEMLNRALDYLLNWLRLNYWDPQAVLIEDYIPCKEGEDDMVNIVNLYQKVALADENHYSVTTKLNSELRKYNIRLDKSKYVILHRISYILMKNNNYNVLNIPDLIVKTGAIFNFHVSQGNHITEEIVASWLPIILVLSHYNILLRLLRMFVEICCENESKNKAKNSAVWLKTLCKLAAKGDHRIFCINENFRNFTSWVILKNNAYAKIYLQEILTLAGYNNNFIIYAYQAIEALVPKSGSSVPSKIYTVDNLKDILDKALYDELVNGVKSKNLNCKWQPVNDTTCLNGIPLGKGPNTLQIHD